MLQKSPGSNDWFLPKRYGYGAGLPISWQGWALIAAYIAVLMGLALIAPLLHGVGVALAIAGILAATGVFALIVARHTRGGWRWRRGDPD